MPGMSASIRMSVIEIAAEEWFPTGDPDLATPTPAKIAVSRAISSNESSISRARNSYSRPKISLGMQ